MMFRPSTVSTNNGRYLPYWPSFSGRNPTTVPSKARLKSYRKTSRSTRGVSLSPPFPELILYHALMCASSYLGGLMKMVLHWFGSGYATAAHSHMCFSLLSFLDNRHLYCRGCPWSQIGASPAHSGASRLSGGWPGLPWPTLLG